MEQLALKYIQKRIKKGGDDGDMRKWDEERVKVWANEPGFGDENSEDYKYLPKKAKEHEDEDGEWKAELKQKIAWCLEMIRKHKASYEKLT